MFKVFLSVLATVILSSFLGCMPQQLDDEPVYEVGTVVCNDGARFKIRDFQFFPDCANCGEAKMFCNDCLDGDTSCGVGNEGNHDGIKPGSWPTDCDTCGL